MAVKFLLGNKKIFLDFLGSISKKDNVAILTHNDLDGIASAVFLEEILKAKGIDIKLIDFLSYKKRMFDEIIEKLEEKKINKIFITDIGVDISDIDGFENLRRKFDVFLIDHHPINHEYKDIKNIIKTEGGDCVAFVVYELGENLFDRKKWEWLVCSAIISDMAYKKREILEFVESIYPEINGQNIEDSEIGELSKTISSALVYYKNNLKKVYDLIKRKNLKDLDKCRKIIDSEIDKYIKKFEKEAEFYPEKDLYFFIFDSKFDIKSIITTIISVKKPNSTFVILYDTGKGEFRISARNQNKQVDMNELMKKGIKGLENATGGGHVPAAGANFMKKDLEIFKRNILS